MHFPLIPVDPIKSISQRALLNYWDRAARGQRFPTLEQFRPDDRTHDPKQLVFWQVETIGPRERRFRALYQGDHVAQVFGNHWPGRTMDQAVPEFARAIALDAANECTRTGCAVYTVLSTVDANGRQVDCERLLLPLGRDGMVEHLAGSLQLISVSGEFRRETVLSSFQLHTEVTCSGKIRGSGQSGAPAAAAVRLDLEGDIRWS